MNLRIGCDNRQHDNKKKKMRKWVDGSKKECEGKANITGNCIGRNVKSK
jgi:hypothetical protein